MIGLATLAYAACSAASGDGTLDAANAPILSERFLAGRLASQSGWNVCVVIDSTALIAKSQCGKALNRGQREFDQLISLTRDAVARSRSDSSAQALHLLALLELRSHTIAPNALDRAVASLERVVARDPNNAAAHNDLAVAYLARAEREQQLGPMLRALEAIDHARAANDTLTSAMFNRALILERLHLIESARLAWTQYLAVERSTPWRDEAHAHLHALESFRTSRLAATPSAESLVVPNGARSRSELVALARGTPQWAREVGFRLLGAWGNAVVNADSARARTALSTARDLARSLDDQGGDRSLSLAIAAIDSTRASVAGQQSLARAHLDYTTGYDLYGRGAYEEASRVLGRAKRGMRAHGSRAAHWAATFEAVALINGGHFAEADEILRQVASAATSAEPALAGKAIWVLGLSQVKRGAYEAATHRYRDAVTFFVKARETENLGMLSSLLTESLALAGQEAASRIEVLRGWALLAPYRSPGTFGNHWGLVAENARSDGLYLAALDVMAEVIQLGGALDRPLVMAWARATRARDLIAVRHLDSVGVEISEAMRWISRMENGVGRELIRADIILAQAPLLRAADPRAARDELLRVVDTYRATNEEIGLSIALYQTALAAREAGDTLTTRRCLEQAVAQIERRSGLFPTAEVRASYYETVEATFDALIALELDMGRPDAAFRYLERARAAAWSASSDRTAGLGIGDVQRHIPPNDLTLEYAVLPDRIVLWVIGRSTWRTETISMRRDSLAALVAQFDVESSLPVVPGGGARGRLYDLLLSRVARDLDSVASITVVPDRELSRIPFAALWDRNARTYVVERVSVRTLPSAAFFSASTRLARNAGSRYVGETALVVGDPAFDRVAVPQVERLPGAADEASHVAELYAKHQLLLGSNAGRDTTVALLGAYSIFHFAGHAVTNPDQPELSYLALAADSPGGDGILRAKEIADLRLSHLRMVVLSGCSTLGVRATHAGALAGLAYSFLRASVPATVSSLWDVDDGTTTPLLVAYHRHLALGKTAPDALRSAQLEALHSGQPTSRAPRAWAAFVYTGP